MLLVPKGIRKIIGPRKNPAGKHVETLTLNNRWLKELLTSIRWSSAPRWNKYLILLITNIPHMEAPLQTLIIWDRAMTNSIWNPLTS